MVRRRKKQAEHLGSVGLGLDLQVVAAGGCCLLYTLVRCHAHRRRLSQQQQLSDKVRGCMVYTERAETAAVSCGTSHAGAVSTPLRWIFKNAP